MILPPSWFRRRPVAARSVVLWVMWAGALALAACAAGERLPPTIGTQPISRADQATAAAAYERGLALFEQGSYEPALAEFTVVVDRYPSSRYAGLSLYWQGRTAYQLGRDEAAAAALDRYLRLASEVPYAEHAALLVANALYNLTRYDEALQTALAVRSAPPEWLDDYLALSRDLLNRLPRAEIEAGAARRSPISRLPSWPRPVGSSVREGAKPRPRRASASLLPRRVVSPT
jgi:tetratricopeptide (TPR) repeat protein